MRLQVPRNAPYKVLKAAWTDDDVMGKWEATSWAKKLAAKKKRANMGDFDRFKLMCARKQRSKAVKVRRATHARRSPACCDPPSLPGAGCRQKARCVIKKHAILICLTSTTVTRIVVAARSAQPTASAWYGGL